MTVTFGVEGSILGRLFRAKFHLGLVDGTVFTVRTPYLTANHSDS